MGQERRTAVGAADASEPVVVVWSAVDAAAALTVARERDHPLRVLVPWSLASVLGATGVSALYEEASAAVGSTAHRGDWIVGCGDHAGLACAMLRNGFSTVLLDPATPARPAVARIAAASGGRVLDDLKGVPQLDLAGVADPAEASRRWLTNREKP